MLDVDKMEELIADYNLTGSIQAPYGRLSKIGNLTVDMKEELDGIRTLNEETAKYFKELNSLEIFKNDIQKANDTVIFIHILLVVDLRL